jgi:tetratricopeptide (TPR) repeat protein
MARRRRTRGEPPKADAASDKTQPAAAPDGAEAEAPTDDVEEAAPAVAAADAPSPAPVEPEAPVPAEAAPSPSADFDAAASQRILRACAGIHSFASSAADEASQAAAPFLSFAQRRRIRALATDFEGRRQTFTVEASASPAPSAAAVSDGASLGRDEIEAIVSHRIDIAIQDVLQRLGISPDATIPRQVERTVEVQLNSQEQRLLDYVKRHLTDSLEMLESTIEERIADYIDSADLGESDRETEEARAEIDAKVEEAREQLLKNIDEVREVQVGFDIANFASQIIEINDTGTGSHGAISDDDIAVGGDDGIEVGGYDEPVVGGDDGIEVGGDDGVEAGGDEDIELGGDEDVEAAADEVEVAADEIEIAADEIEIAADDAVVVDAPEEPLDLELGGDEDDSAEVDVADEVPVEIDLGGEGGPIELDASALEIDEGSGEAATIELDGGEVVNLDAEIDLSDEPLEEISVISPVNDGDAAAEIELDTAELVEFDDDAQLLAGMELDLGEEEEGESEEMALTTLGSGPDDLVVPPVADISDVEVEIEEEEEPESEEARSGHIERYLQRAAEMRNRRQALAAMELYSKVIDLDEDNYEARIGRGVLNLEAKDYKRAIEEFTHA